MKQLKNLFFFLALCAPLTAAAQDIEINAENFPDENFRNFLLEQDYGADGVLTESEIEGIIEIDVSSKSISSLKGIEHFTALMYLDCHYNQLTTLDVSNNTALEDLSCFSNSLITLNVSRNAALRRLDCRINKLTTLDVANNTALTKLDFDNNQLTALDVSNNTSLTDLCCFKNQINGNSMDALINSLPETAAGEFNVYFEKSWPIEGNVITKSQVAVAKAKGWIPYYFDMTEWKWLEYEGMDDDEAASIALPEVENGTAAVYTLQGQKVTAPQKGGIYVVGGKKVVFK